MPLQIKVLTSTRISASGTTTTSLYTVPSLKAAVVKSMRFTNAGDAGDASVTMNIYFGNPSSGGKRVAPVDLALSPGESYRDTEEVTLGAGNTLQVVTTKVGSEDLAMDCVISGIERDA